MSIRLPARLAAALLVSLALLQGCGRKGPLESPAKAAAEPAPASADLIPPIFGTNPDLSQPQATRNAGPDRPFILDPLL